MCTFLIMLYLGVYVYGTAESCCFSSIVFTRWFNTRERERERMREREF